MDYDKIKEKLETYILNELEIAQVSSTFEDKLYARNRAYGALQFVNNEVLPYYDEDLENWWHEKIREKFLE